MLRSLFVLLPTALLPAQTWLIPPGGVVQYDGQEQIDLTKADGSAAQQIWGYLPHARILLESELIPDRTAMAEPPIDVRWLGPFVAFDLQKLKTAGKVKLQVEGMAPFAALLLTGSVDKIDADGEQRFELEVASLPPAAGAVPANLRYLDCTARGKLTVRRTFHPQQGVVTALHAELTLDCGLGPRFGSVPAKLHLLQDWRLRAIEAHDTIALQTRVADAIRKGAAWLKRQIEDPRQDQLRTTDPLQSHGEGRLALALLTLMAAGESPQDEVVARGLDDLRGREIRQTYCLGLAIMALEKSYSSPSERDDLIAGRIKQPRPRLPSDADKKLLAEWAGRLLQNRDTSVDAAYVSRWTYTPSPGFDNSNSQYALLGLFSAQLCGVDQSRGLWLAATQHWLACQHPAEGKTRGLQLVTYQQALGKDFDKLRKTGTVGRTEVRGFSYRDGTEDGDRLPYGSMTCAGIAGLTVCKAALGSKHRIPELRKIDDAIDASFAWLSAHRTVRRNAGDAADRHDAWYYYWMYSLERACELSSVRFIDGWDWYCDGANVLLELQRQDGAFGGQDVEDTCFAVLFLKKAQLPVITGR